MPECMNNEETANILARVVAQEVQSLRQEVKMLRDENRRYRDTIQEAEKALEAISGLRGHHIMNMIAKIRTGIEEVQAELEILSGLHGRTPMAMIARIRKVYVEKDEHEGVQCP